MTLLIDARTYGKCLKAGQAHAQVPNEEVAKILRISKAEWRQYYRESAPIPPDILIRIIDAGLSFMAFRYRNSPSIYNRKKQN